jgi:hypothetical protein
MHFSGTILISQVSPITPQARLECCPHLPSMMKLNCSQLLSTTWVRSLGGCTNLDCSQDSYWGSLPLPYGIVLFVCWKNFITHCHGDLSPCGDVQSMPAICWSIVATADAPFLSSPLRFVSGPAQRARETYGHS